MLWGVIGSPDSVNNAIDKALDFLICRRIYYFHTIFVTNNKVPYVFSWE